MSFTRRQQPEFQALKEAAWVAHCENECLPLKAKAAKDAWYRAELLEATGHESSKDCDPKRDYEKACAHFEGLVGESIKWQMKALDGDKRRIVHEIRHWGSQHNGIVLEEYAPDFEADDAYLRGIASRALGFEFTGDLELLDPEQLLVILRALKIQLRRQHKRGQRTDTIRKAEPEFSFAGEE